MAEQLPPPTRMVLQQFKAKKVAATKGYSLLKNKADALKSKFRTIAKVISCLWPSVYSHVWFDSVLQALCD